MAIRHINTYHKHSVEHTVERTRSQWWSNQQVQEEESILSGMPLDPVELPYCSLLGRAHTVHEVCPKPLSRAILLALSYLKIHLIYKNKTAKCPILSNTWLDRSNTHTHWVQPKPSDPKQNKGVESETRSFINVFPCRGEALTQDQFALLALSHRSV